MCNHIAENQNFCHAPVMTKTNLARRPDGSAPARGPVPPRQASLKIFRPRRHAQPLEKARL
jgi:hypothetical protein